MKKVLFLLSIIIGIASCNDDGLGMAETGMPRESCQLTFKVSPEEAKAEVANFMKQVSTFPVKTRCVGQLQIADVCPIRNGVHTRANQADMSDGYDVDLDTLLYAVNFADSQGFALVAADKRTEPIFAIIDEGSFCVDSLRENKDEGFLMFLDNVIKMEIQDIEDYMKSPETRSLVTTNGYVVTSETAPILHTKWNQEGVYGKYCPNGYAGCVIIATAQILSYYRAISHVNCSYNGTIGESDLHWDKIMSDCESNDGKLTFSWCATSANEIAHLVRYLGVELNADYRKDGTGVKLPNAVDWFNKQAGLKANSIKDYDVASIVLAIMKGNPVLAGGYSGKKKVLGIRVGWTGGHAWVYDGLINALKDGGETVMIHCNWGWGGLKNGYYISRAFNTNTGATIYDSHESQSGTGSNYKYNLKYSIIEPNFQ